MATATMAAGFDHHHQHHGHSSSRMEEKKFEYFASINPMARKIMQEREKIKQKHGPAWEQMSSVEQDTAIDNCLMDPHIRSRYAMHRVDREEVVCYPKLLLQTGQKIVHFGDEDITWQDEHSAPFSWETKSQLDFSLSLGPAEQGVSSSSQTTDAKPTKSAPNSQLGKNTPSANKVSISEGPGLGRRPEEESSFWKISAERSRMEGELADYTSLTPSQIKSMEKGEKPLPSYLRQETSVMAPPAPKEPEAPEPVPAPAPALAPAKSAKQRAPRPPAPPPPVPVAVPVATPAPLLAVAPPAIISIAPGPAPVRVSSTVAGWERSQSTLPSVSNTLDDVFSGSMMSGGGNKASSNKDRERRDREDEASAQLATSPTFSQFNTSNNLLKTGFDFLDNW